LGFRDPVDAALEVCELVPEARAPRSEALGFVAELRDPIAPGRLPHLSDPTPEAEALVAAFLRRGLGERGPETERARAGEDDDARAVGPPAIAARHERHDDQRDAQKSDDDPPDDVRGDAEELERVMWNEAGARERDRHL